MDSSYTRMSPFNYLKAIYTVKGEEGEVGSVFYEFEDGCKKDEEKYDYMIRIFEDISKSGHLHRDSRIPKEAKKGLCHGIKVKKGDQSVKSLQDLIEKIEQWVTWGLPPEHTYEVKVISVDPSMLEENSCKMPEKDYEDVYGPTLPFNPIEPMYLSQFSTLFKSME